MCNIEDNTCKLRVSYVHNIAAEAADALNAMKHSLEKTTPFGVNLMRSQVLYRAAQGLKDVEVVLARPAVPLACNAYLPLFSRYLLSLMMCRHKIACVCSFFSTPLATVLCSPKHSLQSLHRAGPQPQDMQLLLTTLPICKYCAFTMYSKQTVAILLQLSSALRRKQDLLVTPCCAYHDLVDSQLSASSLPWLLHSHRFMCRWMPLHS